MVKCTLVKYNLHLYEISKVVFLLASHSRVFQKSFTDGVKGIWQNKLETETLAKISNKNHNLLKRSKKFDAWAHKYCKFTKLNKYTYNREDSMI